MLIVSLTSLLIPLAFYALKWRLWFCFPYDTFYIIVNALHGMLTLTQGRNKHTHTQTIEVINLCTG
jgi:hypothetical protein